MSKVRKLLLARLCSEQKIARLIPRIETNSMCSTCVTQSYHVGARFVVKSKSVAIPVLFPESLRLLLTLSTRNAGCDVISATLENLDFIQPLTKIVAIPLRLTCDQHQPAADS